MSKKLLNQFFGTKLNAPVALFAKVTIGATGAPTLVSTSGHSKGIASIARNSTGDYTLTLSDPWSKLLGFSVDFLHATDPVAYAAFVDADTVATTKTVGFVTHVAGTATDPANATTLYIRVLLDDSKS